MDEIEEFLKILQDGRCEDVFGTADVNSLDADVVRAGIRRVNIGDRFERIRDGRMFVVVNKAAGGKAYAVSNCEIIEEGTFDRVEFRRAGHMDLQPWFEKG